MSALLVCMTLVGPTVAPGDGRDGQVMTERSIVLTVEVAAGLAEVFELWTTVEGVKTFFAPEARIEARVGGAYEMIFQPEDDPDGARFGTAGAKILRYEPGRLLSFEWKGPPFATEMNVRPFPTWVDVSLTPVGGRGTRVELAHHGFGEGGNWERAHEHFERAWRRVVDRLVGHLSDRSSETAKAPAGAESSVYYAVLLSWGPTRDPAIPVEQEPLMGEHVNYMRGLAERGVLVLGGPYLDRSGGLAVFRADSLEEARRISAADPGCRGGLFTADVRPWLMGIVNLEKEQG